MVRCVGITSTNPDTRAEREQAGPQFAQVNEQSWPARAEADGAELRAVGAASGEGLTLQEEL